MFHNQGVNKSDITWLD